MKAIEEDGRKPKFLKKIATWLIARENTLNDPSRQ